MTTLEPARKIPRPSAARWRVAAATALALSACATPPPAGEAPAPPRRIVLHYDFAGDWAATAGDSCEERLDLSQEPLLTIANLPERGPSAFHIARFAALDGAEAAQAVVGVVEEGGVLPLAIETAGMVDGRRVDVTLELTLRAETTRLIRLTAYTATIHEPTGETTSIDLIADATRTGGSILSEAGQGGLCLKRL